jgi:hypothetical protein
MAGPGRRASGMSLAVPAAHVQVQGGHATRVELDLDLAGGWVTVTDNGRGIPTDPHPRTGCSTLETVGVKSQGRHFCYNIVPV